MGSGKLHSGCKRSHRSVVRAHYGTVRRYIRAKQFVQSAYLCELFFKIQLCIVAHPLEFVAFPSDDPVADHNIRETKPDGIKPAQIFSGGCFHLPDSFHHLLRRSIFGKGKTVHIFFLPGSVQAGSAAHQPGKKHDRIRHLTDQGKSGGEPVIFLAQHKFSACSGGEFDIRASHIDS